MSYEPEIQQVQGVSLPRSGHHLLARLLSDILGDSIYCDYYGCCRSIPCQSGGKFQKHHDLMLQLPRRSDVRHIVQFRRDPQAQFEAYFRFFRSRYQGQDRHFEVQDHFPYFQDYFGKYFADLSTDELVARSYDRFILDHMPYYLSFLDKWVFNTEASGLRLSYEDLIDQPVGALNRAVMTLTDSPCPERLLGQAVAREGVALKHNLALSPLYDPHFCERYDLTRVARSLREMN